MNSECLLTVNIKNIESQKNPYVRILTEKRKLYKYDT